MCVDGIESFIVQARFDIQKILLASFSHRAAS